MNIFKRIVRIFTYFTLIISCVLLVLCGLNSDNLSIHSYALSNEKVNGTFTCLVVSDFHHHNINFSNTSLPSAIKKEKANAIFFTGDMIDSYTNNLDDIQSILRSCCSLTPYLYYVTGNHEEYAPLWNDLEKILPDFGVKEMDANYDDITFPSYNIKIFGLADPRMLLHKMGNRSEEEEAIKAQLEMIKEAITPTSFNILISHRPEYMNIYSEYGFDMVVAGHTHGGQIRFANLSFGIDGYSSGEYKKNNTTMYVSRGLGHAALLPLRINCDPEVVKIVINS